MTMKSRDEHQRWRSVTVGFRMSPEENEHLNRLVAISGLTKQDYIISRLLCKDVVVVGNPRVFKALKCEMETISSELSRLSSGEEISDELFDLMQVISTVMSGLSKDRQEKSHG